MVQVAPGKVAVWEQEEEEEEEEEEVETSVCHRANQCQHVQVLHMKVPGVG